MASNEEYKEQWEIVRITSHYPRDARHGNGQVFYKVKWRLSPGMEENWGEEENWVHEEDMNCEGLIKSYWEEHDDNSRVHGVTLDTPPNSIKRKHKMNTPSLAAKNIKTKEVTSTRMKNKKEKKAPADTKRTERMKSGTPNRPLCSPRRLRSDESGSEKRINEEASKIPSCSPLAKSHLSDTTPSIEIPKEKRSKRSGDAEVLRQQQEKNEELRRQIAELSQKSMKNFQQVPKNFEKVSNEEMENSGQRPKKEVKKPAKQGRKSLLRDVLDKSRPQKRRRASDVSTRESSAITASLNIIKAIKADTSFSSPSSTFSKLKLESETPPADHPKARGPPRAKKSKLIACYPIDVVKETKKDKDPSMIAITEDTEGEADESKIMSGPEVLATDTKTSTEELVKALKEGRIDQLTDLLKRFSNECWERKLDAVNTLKPVYVLMFLSSPEGEPEQDWSATIFENVPGQMPNHICQCVPTDELYSKYPEFVAEAEQRFYTTG